MLIRCAQRYLSLKHNSKIRAIFNVKLTFAEKSLIGTMSCWGGGLLAVMKFLLLILTMLQLGRLGGEIFARLNIFFYLCLRNGDFFGLTGGPWWPSSNFKTTMKLIFNKQLQVLLTLLMMIAPAALAQDGNIHIPDGVTGEAEQYYRSAVSGDPEAQLLLAYCYRTGEGVPRDYAQAFFWYSRASQSGNALAIYNMAVCYDEGIGITQNIEKAARFYEIAAQKGDPMAQVSIGNCYFKGEGVAQDYKKAVKWFNKAADQGVASAQFWMGACLDQGLGVKQDHKKAVEWYAKAAEQGDAQSQYNLGISYLEGEGVAKDETQAIYWLRQAAAQGDADAQAVLRELNVDWQ